MVAPGWDSGPEVCVSQTERVFMTVLAKCGVCDIWVEAGGPGSFHLPAAHLPVIAHPGTALILADLPLSLLLGGNGGWMANLPLSPS